jgi:hypothetical protein
MNNWRICWDLGADHRSWDASVEFQETLYGEFQVEKVWKCSESCKFKQFRRNLLITTNLLFRPNLKVYSAVKRIAVHCQRHQTKHANSNGLIENWSFCGDAPNLRSFSSRGSTHSICWPFYVNVLFSYRSFVSLTFIDHLRDLKNHQHKKDSSKTRVSTRIILKAMLVFWNSGKFETLHVTLWLSTKSTT